MRCAILGSVLVAAACGGPPPPAPPPPPPPPVATVVASPPPAPFSRDAVSRAIYAPLFQAEREWKLTGNRHVVSAGDAAGSLHYKVIVRCRVTEVVEGPAAIASRVECVNFPEDSLALNPLDRVWVAGRNGLYRADEIPTSEAGWSSVLQGRRVFGNPPEPFERGEECRERVIDVGSQWCWTEDCAGDPLHGGRLCFSKEGALVSIEAHSMAETSEVVGLGVVPSVASSTASTDELTPSAEPNPTAGAPSTTKSGSDGDPEPAE